MRPVIGTPIVELARSYPPVIDTALMPSEILGPASLSFTSGQMMMGSVTNATSSIGWFVAACPIAYPFFLDKPVTVYQLGWWNGSTAGGNWDIGIYDTSWNRLVSAGSTGGSGNNLLQFVDVTDTPLGPGKYYLVAVHDVNTASHARVFALGPGKEGLAMIDVQDSATTAFPLPDPLTNMAVAATATSFYTVYAAIRTLV